MKSLKLFLGGVSILALLALGACNDNNEPEPDDQTEHDDAYWAGLASISSSDSNFTSTSDGGTIYFKTEGGSVAVSVDCGCDWTVENSAADLFSTSLSSTSLTVSAGQNTVEEDLTGTITLKTATDLISFATITVTQSAYGAPEITVETNEVNIAAVGDLSAEVAVEATADWTVEAADSWLTVTKTDDGITLTATENEDTAERSTKVTLTCTDGYKTAYEYINVNQDGKAYITLSEETVSLTGAGDSATVTVESNFDWDYSYDTSNDWYSITRDGDNLIITALKDNETTEDFEDSVTITAGDGGENVIEAQFTIVEGYAGNALILVYTITDAGTNVTLPLTGTVDCTVNWGDGSSSDTVTSTLPSHTYEKTGEYTVIINGTVTEISSKSLASSSSPNLTLTAVKQWGITGLTNMDSAFYCCGGLKTIPTDTAGSFTEVTSFDRGFYHCTSLEAIPKGIFDNCTKVTSFSETFSTCSLITSVPEGLYDSAVSVTTYSSGFYECIALETIPAALFAASPKVTTFKTVFYDCGKLTSIPEDLFSGNTSVTTFQSAFYGCESLQSVPANLFANNTAVTTFYGVFNGCKSLKTVPENLFANNTEVTNFTWLFANCENLEEVPENLFANNTKVTAFDYLFQYCYALKTVPENLFAKNTVVQTFVQTFYDCTSLTSVPENLFAGNTAVTSFKYLFGNCTALTAVPAGLFAKNTEVSNFSYMFYKCTALTTVPVGIFDNNLKVSDFTQTFLSDAALTGESPYTVIDGAKVHLYQRMDDAYKSNYSGVSKISSTKCFDGCTGLSDYYTGIPTDWGGGYTGEDLAEVIGTYTITGIVNGQNISYASTTWTLKIMAYSGTTGDYNLDINGIVPWAATYDTYGDNRTSVAAYYQDGKIVIPSQCLGRCTVTSTDGSKSYLGFTPVTEYKNGSFYYSSSYPSTTLTYDTTTGVWTSDYGMFAVGCSGTSIDTFTGSYFQAVGPAFTMTRTSTSYDVPDDNVAAGSNTENVQIHTALMAK